MTTDTELTPHTVRMWADTVQIGECITFPNGLVVDKRPLPLNFPVAWPPQPTSPTFQPTTW